MTMTYPREYPSIAQALRFSTRAGALSIACLALQACGGLPEGEADQSGEEQPAVDQSALRGTASTQTGVVRTDFSESEYCSAAMIGPTVLVTAGHCIAGRLPAGSKTGTVNVRVSYYVSGSQVVTGFEPYTAHLYPTYNGGGDGANDFAVLVKASGRFPNTQAKDYAFIYTDTMNAYSRLQLFGYGAYGFDGSGGKVLRTGTMEVDWFGSQHFLLIQRGARNCAGDSGGPAAVYVSSSSPELQVLGVASAAQVTPGGYCGADGELVRYSRLSGKVSWIQQITGIPCTQMKSPVTNRLVTRCFSYSTLRRTTYDCRTKTPVAPEQTIDLTNGYSNYTCGNRYQELCVDDGTPDRYYVERCE